MSAHNQIDYVEFPALDLIKIKQFYSSIFGWAFTDYGPDYTSFEDGRLTGGFEKATHIPASSPLIVLYSNNLEETETAIVNAGGTITRPTFSFPGGRRFHFTDPSGNQLAVWSE